MTRWTWDTWWFSPWRWSRADPERALVLTENGTNSRTWQRRSSMLTTVLISAVVTEQQCSLVAPFSHLFHRSGGSPLKQNTSSGQRRCCHLGERTVLQMKDFLYWDSTLVLSFEKSCLIVNHTPHWNFYSYLLEIRLTLVFGNFLVKREVCWKYCVNIYKVMSI